MNNSKIRAQHGVEDCEKIIRALGEIHNILEAPWYSAVRRDILAALAIRTHVPYCHIHDVTLDGNVPCWECANTPTGVQP